MKMGSLIAFRRSDYEESDLMNSYQHGLECYLCSIKPYLASLTIHALLKDKDKNTYFVGML